VIFVKIRALKAIPYLRGVNENLPLISYFRPICTNLEQDRHVMPLRNSEFHENRRSKSHTLRGVVN